MGGISQEAMEGRCVYAYIDVGKVREHQGRTTVSRVMQALLSRSESFVRDAHTVVPLLKIIVIVYW